MKEELKYVDTLEFYDVPQVFLAKNKEGVKFMCLLEEIGDDSLVYMAVSLSEDRLNDYLNGKIDLRSVYTNIEDGYSYWEVHMRGFDIVAEESSLVEDYLPESGFFNSDK